MTVPTTVGDAATMARSILLILTTIFLCFPSMARAADEEETRQEEFVAQILPQIEKVKARSGSEEIKQIPNKIVVAQAALESGWGTSVRARKLGNLFGLQNARGKPMRFASPEASIARYLSTLAEHEAYVRFRVKLRQGADPYELAKALKRYSENPEYATLLVQMLRSPAIRDL